MDVRTPTTLEEVEHVSEIHKSSTSALCSLGVRRELQRNISNFHPVQLIHRLYGSSEEADVRVQIQEVLQRFQKSPEGWQLSQALIARPGDNIKVFGVLTIIVKLNTERYG